MLSNVAENIFICNLNYENMLRKIMVKIVLERIDVLWQPLDQCLIVALLVDLKGRYLVGNMSCVIHKRT